VLVCSYAGACFATGVIIARLSSLVPGVGAVAGHGSGRELNVRTLNPYLLLIGPELLAAFPAINHFVLDFL